jgi:hypothetical protein
MSPAESLAREFHAVRERLAPQFTYEPTPAVDFDDLHYDQRRLLIAVMQNLLDNAVIETPTLL